MPLVISFDQGHRPTGKIYFSLIVL